jgi:hypothetical protein
VVLNGENSAGGFGITPEIVREFLELGVDVITTGNHVWDKREILPAARQRAAAAPAGELPARQPGPRRGGGEVGGDAARGAEPAGPRLHAADRRPLPRRGPTCSPSSRATADVVVVDFHAEATSEKQAIARYVDGRVAAVVGTHTHVQTADERVLPKGHRVHHRPRPDRLARRGDRDEGEISVERQRLRRGRADAAGGRRAAPAGRGRRGRPARRPRPLDRAVSVPYARVLEGRSGNDRVE